MRRVIKVYPQHLGPVQENAYEISCLQPPESGDMEVICAPTIASS
jgi:hypothetical protein